jgi:N-acylneuraminate cytidylyltransferase
MRLAVIPARGGSKRIPRKNINLFGGKPIIAWSICAAINSNCFDRIIVSTDDPEIAEIAKAFGADVPFMRPVELSDDFSGTIPVVAHAIKWQNQNGEMPQQVCCIYATAPFIRSVDIVCGLKILNSDNVDYAFAVTKFTSPIQRAIRVTEDRRIEMLRPEYFSVRSQDLDEAWHDAGQFYWGKARAWLEHREVFTNQAAPVPIPHYRVQDIDTQDDWLRAEALFNFMLHNKKYS